VLGRIDHIGVAVEDLDEAVALYRDKLGLAVEHRERVEGFGVEAVLMGIGDGHVELLEPISPESAVAEFLERRGPGMHHVAYATEDVEAALAAARGAGLQAVDEEPRIGIRGIRVAFLHPKSTGGVLVELVETGGEH
jgi:methylmalonyl-CoA/ethylmalonyl-CoA epimerase